MAELLRTRRIFWFRRDPRILPRLKVFIRSLEIASSNPRWHGTANRDQPGAV
jgi:hypothetical protein